jgi:hypothetical protein
MPLPDYEPRGIQEGTYTFTCQGEPELRRHQSGKGKEFVTAKFEFVAEGDGDKLIRYIESFLPWEDRYQDLLMALGGEPDDKGRISGKTIDPDGKSFVADIKYEPDKNDPDKEWPRMKNIRGEGVESKQKSNEDDLDIPF